MSSCRCAMCCSTSSPWPRTSATSCSTWSWAMRSTRTVGTCRSVSPCCSSERRPPSSRQCRCAGTWPPAPLATSQRWPIDWNGLPSKDCTSSNSAYSGGMHQTITLSICWPFYLLTFFLFLFYVCLHLNHCIRSHCAYCFRYFKLFLPVDLRYVKFEVRDLCMLRLLHAFCESMPLLLLQSYLLWTDEGVWLHLRDLNKVAVGLSTISVCWALASFGKNVRMQNVHRLVLTWLGVIFQVKHSPVVTQITSINNQVIIIICSLNSSCGALVP